MFGHWAVTLILSIWDLVEWYALVIRNSQESTSETLQGINFYSLSSFRGRIIYAWICSHFAIHSVNLISSHCWKVQYLYQFGLFAACYRYFSYLVSAFYAECANKKISMNTHIWTKSKFYGMSIGVINIGEGKKKFYDRFIFVIKKNEKLKILIATSLEISGVIYLPEYNEEYVITFPNAYCR